MHKPNRLKYRVTKTVEVYEDIDSVDENIVDELGDPAVNIPQRIEALSNLLGIDEVQAQRLYFQHRD